ncbi:LuxR family transcriptional regulator [Burkholderia dolosa]|jgi:LuxR family quorum-sensing transcriptional regulator LasR|uniref:LuxR family transcriptional regulator n=1 Tax=Burkholderia dolosa TaxID=152500 RepID=A0A892ID15_9BURK|nr:MULTISPECIES: LuxR family transcriptional regulator [Burkholderia]AKE06151.1 hypothetical protein XM57_26725 [Burkholderia cepacia]AJY09894.1 bacterial regulatory s, luxR family protein [Burkholderia dolosa AU0158]AYZ95163.1 LuxR family transcriptional regulator [Burkholderia dolosa]ETP62769.1 LuxR family transcriptional regulator [Burkholderia dolosa PC543]MBR8313569.1 LuxR family transcriptional regulator [Burkholderia dolosa]
MISDLLEPAPTLSNAGGEDAWADALTEIGAQHGFDYTLFAILPRPGLGFKDIFLKSNYPKEWRETYDKQGLAAIDPTVKHIFGQSRPLIWHEKTFATDCERELYDGAASHGLRSGIIFPIHGPQHETGMLGFATSDAPGTGVWQGLSERLPMLGMLRDAAFESAQAFLVSHVASVVPKVTRREKECLKWMACGKSIWEMSKILTCSEATINFHMTNLRNKFGVTSRAALVYKAARMGLLDMA